MYRLSQPAPKLLSNHMRVINAKHIIHHYNINVYLYTLTRIYTVSITYIVSKNQKHCRNILYSFIIIYLNYAIISKLHYQHAISFSMHVIRFNLYHFIHTFLIHIYLVYRICICSVYYISHIRES